MEPKITLRLLDYEVVSIYLKNKILFHLKGEHNENE